MIITPTSVGVITRAVRDRLLKDTSLDGVTIERSAEVNSTPGNCPWVGVYRGECQFQSRTLGVSTGYRQQRVQVMLLLQEADPTSGEDCEDRLNSLVDRVVASLLSDTTLGGVALTIEDFSVRYPDYRRIDDEMFLQTAMLFFTVITHVQVGG